jgi:hypothetical protein
MHSLILLNFFVSLHKICPIFVEMQVFIFSNKIKYYLFIYIFDVVKMVIIHKKVTTFGYTRVV